MISLAGGLQLALIGDILAAAAIARTSVAIKSKTIGEDRLFWSADLAIRDAVARLPCPICNPAHIE